LIHGAHLFQNLILEVVSVEVDEPVLLYAISYSPLAVNCISHFNMLYCFPTS